MTVMMIPVSSQRTMPHIRSVKSPMTTVLVVDETMMSEAIDQPVLTKVQEVARELERDVYIVIRLINKSKTLR